jgi:hypothetical protein
MGFFAALPLLFVTGAPQLSPRGGVAITPARHHNGLGPQALFHASALAGIQRIAGAFVKTFKRDYARPSILPDAETLIALLPAWFEDYNEVHRYSGSPGEFLRLSA